MDDNVFGTAIVLYTFSKDGNNERYKRKVDNLKQLIPGKTHELEDQSTILIQSKCNIEDLQQKLKDKYNEKLEENEYITLISVNGDGLKCFTLQHSSLEEKIEKILEEINHGTDMDKKNDQTKHLINLLKENMQNVFHQLVVTGDARYERL